MTGDRYDPPPVAVRAAVAAALAEDFGPLGDVTSLALVPSGATGRGRFVARSAGVLAGTACATEVFAQLDPAVVVTWHAADGRALAAGACFGAAAGPTRSLLGGERSALNFLGHLSGIATLTRAYVDAAGPGTRIRETRKTLPGLRALEKAAVRAGGGANHRGGLSDAVLVKDNHLRIASVADAVAAARSCWPGMVVEVECDTLDQVAQAREAAADLILLDNMTPDEVAKAAVLTRDVPGLLIEVSGGVTLDAVAAYAAAGADLISVGALTHSAPNLDLAFDLDPLLAAEAGDPLLAAEAGD